MLYQGEDIFGTGINLRLKDKTRLVKALIRIQYNLNKSSDYS